MIRAQNAAGSGESNVVVIAGIELVTGSGLQPDTNSLTRGKLTAHPAAKNSITMTFKLERPIRRDELKKQLLAAGVEIPPTVFFYTDSSILLVRGSEKQLALVHRLVLKLNGFSPKEIEAASKGFSPAESEISTAGNTATNLFMRTFRVDPNTFYLGLENAKLQNSGHINSNAVDIGDSGRDGVFYITTKNSATTPSTLARAFFTDLGVNLQQPPGKSVFFHDRLGLLFVKATESDLDTIERAIQVINTTPLQLHVKARFLEVPKGASDSLKNLLAVSNSVDGKLTWILTSQNMAATFRTLEHRKDIEVLGEPECTTLSGRQTQMRATSVVTVVTNLNFQELWTNKKGCWFPTSIVPQTTSVETGPILDVVPYVLSDGYTINLALIPSVTEFLGYDKSTNTTAAYDQAGEKIDVPEVLPRFYRPANRRNFEFVGQPDGDPRRIARNNPCRWQRGPGKIQAKPVGKELLVFVTATIVDPAGNRVHSSDELPFTKNGIPPQPPQPK